MVSGGLIEQALEGYDAEAQAGGVEAAAAQRAEMLERFPRSGWPEMPLERYALGQIGHPDNFCRWMEFKAVDLGSIKGGSARKHHIYRQAAGGWWFESDRYDSVEQAWQAVRSGFVEAIALGEAGEWEAADALPSLRGARRCWPRRSTSTSPTMSFRSARMPTSRTSCERSATSRNRSTTSAP